MKPRQLSVLSAWVLVFSVGLSGSASGQDITTVTVQGEALIEGADLPRARQRALQEAFNVALTQVMGAYLTADSYTRNYESIERNVYSRTEGYIKTYEVVKEAPEEGLLELTVRVEVSAEPLKDDLTALGILLDAMGNPLTFVQGDEEGLDSAVSARSFEENLARHGFQVQSSGGSSHDLLILLRGRLQSTNELGGLGMYGAVVSLEATASWQPDGRSIGSVAESANGAGLTAEAALKDAYGKAADKAFPSLLERVTHAWQAERSTGRLVSVEVDSAEMADVAGFKRELSRFFGVDKVELKGFQPGRGDLLVRFRGNAPQLAELIDMRDFQRYSVRVTAVDGSALAVSVAAR